MQNPKIVLETNDTIQTWIKFLDVHLNEPAVNKNVRQIRYLASTLSGDNKFAWLLKAINFIDLTTLSGDDTSTTVEIMCKRAVQPLCLPFDLDIPTHTAAVCVYPSRVKDAVATLKNLNMNTVKIASVAGGFPSGQYPLETRLQEVRYAIECGAQEIDVVIDRSLVLSHEWLKLYDELKQIRAVCNKKKPVCLKVILSTGDLFSLKDVYKTSMVAMYAGANFIKTSTGKEAVNATLPVGVVMCRAIKEFERLTSIKVGLKPAGGIKTAQEALEWMVLVKEELGKDWLTNTHFRIGASSLLDDVVKELTNLYISGNTEPSQLYYESKSLEPPTTTVHDFSDQKAKPKSEEKKTKFKSEEKASKSEAKNKFKSEEKTKSKREQRDSKNQEKTEPNKTGKQTKNEEKTPIGKEEQSKSKEKIEPKDEEKIDSKSEEKIEPKDEEKNDPKSEEKTELEKKD